MLDDQLRWRKSEIKADLDLDIPHGPYDIVELRVDLLRYNLTLDDRSQLRHESVCHANEPAEVVSHFNFPRTDDRLTSPWLCALTKLHTGLHWFDG